MLSHRKLFHFPYARRCHKSDRVSEVDCSISFKVAVDAQSIAKLVCFAFLGEAIVDLL